MTTEPKSIMDPLVRHTAISDGEWIVTFQLTIGGKRVGETFEARYADSVVSKNPLMVGELMGRRLGEIGVRVARQIKTARSRRR